MAVKYRPIPRSPCI